MRISLEDHCKQHGNQALLRQWDTEKNLPLTPGQVTFGSGKKFGGSANENTPGMPLSAAGSMEAAALSAPEGRLFQALPIWKRCVRTWLLSGIPPGTGTSPPAM